MEAAATSIALWPGDPDVGPAGDGTPPSLDAYALKTDEALGAILVCPGGGYAENSVHEKEPVARRFNRLGFHVFVVNYRVAPARFPAQAQDAARALRIIRQHAAEWNVDPSHVAVCGFSAGGHVAASLATLGDSPELHGPSPIDTVPNRPDALILCYPVITTGQFAHGASIGNLLGPSPPPALRERVSLELRVSGRTPPVFLWHTLDDPVVPVENSLLFAQALRRRGVPFELHIYPHGYHGICLAEDDAHVSTWIDLCGQWLRMRGWKSAV